MSFTFGSNTVQQQPTTQSGFAFGLQQQQQNKGFGFGTTPSTGFGFGTATTTTAPTGFSFGAPSTTPAPAGFSFGAPSTTPAPSGFSFGTPSTFSLGTQNAAPSSGGLSFGNQAPTTSSSSFMFGATASTPRPMFGPTTTTNSAVSFGATQPAMGGSFGFGAAAPNATAPTATATNPSAFGSGNLSFGPVTSAFGVTTTTANSGFQFGAAAALPVTTTAPTGLQFGPQSSATGFQFNPTPVSTNALQFGVASNTSTASGGFGFGATSTGPATGLTFGVPSTSTPVQTAPFNLSTTAPTVPATTATGFVVGGTGFGMPTTTTTTTNMFGVAPVISTVGTGFGMPSVASTTASQFGSGVNIATVAPVGFNTTMSQATSVVTSTATSAPGFQFGPPSSTNSFAFGVKPVSGTAETSISEPIQLSSSSVPSFGFPPASVSTSIAPTSEPSQKIQATAPIPSTASTALPAFSFATAPSTSTPGFSFPNVKPTGSTTVPTSATPSLFGAVATLSSAPSVSSAITSAVLSTTTSVTQSTSTSVMNFRQLEDAINKWKIELEEQEKIFIDQATQVNAWDRLLIANGEKITVLNDAVERVKLDQQRLDLELDFILAQQSELEELLVPLEKSMEASPNMHAQQHADLEREHTYHLAENIDAQLKRMSEDIREIIEHVNTANKARDDQDPVQQIAKILNAHMDALQWIDQNTVALQKRLEGISKIHETEKRETETSFRGGY